MGFDIYTTSVINSPMNNFLMIFLEDFISLKICFFFLIVSLLKKYFSNKINFQIENFPLFYFYNNF